MAQQKTKFAVNPVTGALDLITNVAALVDGPSSATDNAVARYDGTTGKLIQNSLVTIDDSGNIATPAQMTVGLDATTSLQVVTKQQLDAAINGVQRKSPVRAASVGNLTLSGEQTVDGIALVTNDRVLVKDQATQTENGIYIVDSGAWIRSADANSSSELNHAIVSVQAGTINANRGYEQTTDNPVIGSDNIVWVQAYGPGSYTADGQGIELVGATFQLELDGSTLSKSSAGLKVADGGISDTQINASAGIVYSKLNLANSIVNADVATGAAIDRAKLASGTANRVVVNNGTGVLSDAAAITANRALISDANGIPTHSTVTDTELGYVSGVTSGIQAQINSKFGFSTATVSVNTSAVNNTIYLVNSSGGAINITLPAPISNGYVQVKDRNGTSNINAITVLPNGAETIDGAASHVMNSNYDAKTFISDGTNWYII